MAKRPRPSASQEDLQERDEAIDGKLLRYQIAQLGASLQARQEELQRLQSRVETLERELAEHDVAQKPELRPEWEPLVQAALAARKVERLEQDLEDARQQLTQQRRLLVRLECGVSVTGTSTATDQAPVSKPDSSPASEQSSAPERNDTLAGTAAAEAPSSTSAGPQQVDTKQVSVLQSQVNELETRISLLAEELAQERELARAVREQLESSAREKAELASALQVAQEQAQNPEPEVIRASATYKSMEAHLLILLRAEQKWSQDREALVRERDELLIRANQEQTVEKRELLSEIEKLKAKINEKNTETEWLKENVAKLQMMYEEKKKVAVDPVVLDETSRAVRQLQERNADLSTKLQSIRTAEAVSLYSY
jgi:chromosome segregation ATPase